MTGFLAEGLKVTNRRAVGGQDAQPFACGHAAQCPVRA